MTRTPSAILLVALLVMRAVLGMDFTASVWCGGEASQHVVSMDSPCAHGCDHEKPLLRPVPVDLHEQGCGCDSGEQFGGEVFTLVPFDSGQVTAWQSTSPPWVYEPGCDFRVVSFRGPPQVVRATDDWSPGGRLVILESDRLNI